MAKVYGYIRISTQRQNLERQERNILSENSEAVIVRETYTGKTLSRPEFQKILKVIKAGDTIIFDSVSRMSRNAADGFALYKELYNKGVNLVFLKEHHIDTATYSDAIKKQVDINIATGDSATDDFLNGQIELLNKYVLALAEKQIELAFEQSQKEVDDLRQRTKEGIETARRNGKRIGTPAGSVLHVKKKEPIKELIKKHSKDFCDALKDSEVMNVINGKAGLHIGRNTCYKYKRELLSE